MFEKLDNLDLNLNNDKKNLFNKYIELFVDYNNKVNLISNNDVKVLFEKHIYDSLALNLFFKKYKIQQNIKLLDIGTGGGFPAMPLALCFEKMQICAVDSINKKINFIKTTSTELGLKNIEPICSRVEDLPEAKKKSFDIVTTRAMAELREILEYAIPFLKVGSYFVAFKSIKAEEELKNATSALKALNTVLVDKIEYTLPIEGENRRVLLVFKKTKDILPSFPRKNGLVKKRPL